MKTVFFTIISDSHYAGCRTDQMIHTFKKFHPDIPLVVFGQKEIDETFASDSRLSFYNSKATFAKKLMNEYELVVNIDADHLIFDRLDEILVGDYDVSAPSNFNQMENSWLSTKSISSTGGVRSEKDLISANQYIQGGLIASTSKQFWEHLEYASLTWSNHFGLWENDVLNVVCHLFPYKFKVMDGAWEFTDKEFKNYYGCASLGREGRAFVDGEKVYIGDKQLKAYHFARGGSIKLRPDQLFSPHVCSFINENLLK